MGGIEGNNNDVLRLGKKGNQINLNDFNGKGIKQNDINKSIFQKFDFNKDGQLDEKEVEVLKAFLSNRAGNDGVLSKREVKQIKQFGTKKSDVKNFYAALNDMYSQQVAANNKPAQPQAPTPAPAEEQAPVQEPVEEQVTVPVEEVQEQEQPEQAKEPENVNHQYKVNYKDTWYGIVQAKYGITDHKQTMEIVRQLKAQNNVDPKATNMPKEITLPENIKLKNGTEIKMADIDAAVDQSHWGYKTTSKTGRYTITQNGKTKYYEADGTELKQSYYEAREASADKRKVSENGSGRYSYTAEDGETLYFDADGTLITKEYYEQRENEYSAVNAQKETVKNARAAFEQQQKQDGWAGKTADAVSVLWNSDNRAVKVEEDLKTYENQIKELQTAQSKGAAEFSAKFKEIYGVPYNPENVAAYEANPTDENYKKAYGTKNDIHKRVMDYNISQQTGAEVVKGAATVAAGIAVGVATGGTGFVAMGAAAAGTAAASATINTSDRLTSDVGLKEGEFGDIAKNAVIDGASVLAGGVIGKAASAAVKGVNTASTVARAGINAAGDVAIGAGTEYMQTGQVTLEGTAINAATAGIGFAAESGVLKRVASKVRNKPQAPKTDIPAQPVSTKLSDNSTLEFTNPSARPYYKAGVDYNQAPSFTKYSKEELKNMFEAEPLTVGRFRQLADNNYEDLRLSGKYTVEESITGNFYDIWESPVKGANVIFAHGWLWHKLDNGCKGIGKDRISLSVKADPKMLAELDELMLRGSYKDAAGNIHQLKGKEFTKGYYKTDIDEENWLQRHDPLTFYFDETVSEEMIDALAIVTDKYKRIPQRELPGAVDGCPWVAHEAYTTEADIDALVKEAGSVDKNLADAIKSEGNNISTGQYNSYKKLLDDYKQYLA